MGLIYTNRIISAISAIRLEPLTKIAVYGVMSLCSSVLGQDVVVNPEPAPTPESLIGRPIPTPSNLSEFVKNRAAAIALGKALFWDMQLGSDGITSCASCHFHAGADNRSKNQVSPGLLRLTEALNAADPDVTFQTKRPNGQLTLSNFPLRKLADINDRSSSVLSDSNDRISSQGVFKELFNSIFPCSAWDSRTVVPDAIFNVKGINTRRVEPRNTPSTINAVFNLRNFWDGRAQDIFNGVNPWGRRDANARVIVADSPTSLRAVAVAINNASLASQAVGPPLSPFEMSADGRTFSQLGKKMLQLRPLAKQLVHQEDSVLGTLRNGRLPGLSKANYAQMITEAFQPKWWNGAPLVETNPDGSFSRIVPATLTPAANQFPQMAYNFSLFFGLAVQLYESTLVSDQSPFDKHVQGDKKALTAQQKLGLSLFFGSAKCANCHGSGEFTKATVHHAKNERIEAMIMGDKGVATYDNGFYNIGVRPTREDIGVGGTDPFGNPLSESRLAQNGSFESIVGHAPNESVSPGARTAANGAFKTPGLRNIELTAPYFHNGGQGTLRQVVDFYNRGGDFHDQNINDLDPDVETLGLSDAEKDALVAFMKSLTDERVRKDAAPFDHPQLFIPNGHLGNENSVTNDGQGRAKETLIELPATGRTGGTIRRNFLQ
jgi:cytochrome c peroxidase